MSRRHQPTVNGTASAVLKCLRGFFQDGHGMLPDSVAYQVCEALALVTKDQATRKYFTAQSNIFNQLEPYVIDMLATTFGLLTRELPSANATRLEIIDAVKNGRAQVNLAFADFTGKWMEQVRVLPDQVFDMRKFDRNPH